MINNFYSTRIISTMYDNIILKIDQFTLLNLLNLHRLGNDNNFHGTEEG